MTDTTSNLSTMDNDTFYGVFSNILTEKKAREAPIRQVKETLNYISYKQVNYNRKDMVLFVFTGIEYNQKDKTFREALKSYYGFTGYPKTCIHTLKIKNMYYAYILVHDVTLNEIHEYISKNCFYGEQHTNGKDSCPLYLKRACLNSGRGSTFNGIGTASCDWKSLDHLLELEIMYQKEINMKDDDFYSLYRLHSLNIYTFLHIYATVMKEVKLRVDMAVSSLRILDDLDVKDKTEKETDEEEE